MSGLGFRLASNYFGFLGYADDFILLSHIVNPMRTMLTTCEQFALHFDKKFNTQISCYACL